MLNDYRGPFDPTFHLGMLSRRGLAVLGREYQMAAHLQDRAGIPQVLARYGAKAMREVAIDEWMAATAIYTRRIQSALNFRGDDVGTIFKGMQFDVGAPHGFLDFQFKVSDDGSGEFWLPHCGALMDVEPMGEKFVVGMCHDIEDPTFDATAAVTNARAQIRPIHRPPRVPADRLPHCHWRVRIEPDAAPVEEIPLAARVRESRLARLGIPSLPVNPEPGGLADYSGPFDPGMQLEDLAHPALARVAQEFCLQGHLLVRTFMMSIADRWGVEMAREIASQQWVGIAAVAAERVRNAMGFAEEGGLDALAKLFQLHPAFHPRAYVDLHVERTGDRLRCWIGDSDAWAEGDDYSWLALLGAEPHRALGSIVRTVDPRARCLPCDVPRARAAWEIVIDSDAEPAPEAPEVGLTRMSTGAAFRFAPRRPVRP